MHLSSFCLAIYPALAEATARAPQSHEPQLLDVDGTLFINLGLFLIAMFVLTQFLWKPYLRVRAARTSRVEGYREDAKRLEAEAAARFAKVEAELADVRRAGSQERARVRQEAQAREHQIIGAAQTVAQQSLNESRQRIDAALAGERRTLAARAESLGRDLAEKVLGRKVA